MVRGTWEACRTGEGARVGRVRVKVVVCEGVRVVVVVGMRVKGERGMVGRGARGGTMRVEGE